MMASGIILLLGVLASIVIIQLGSIPLKEETAKIVSQQPELFGTKCIFIANGSKDYDTCPPTAMVGDNVTIYENQFGVWHIK